MFSNFRHHFCQISALISAEMFSNFENISAEISAEIWQKWCRKLSPPKIISAELNLRRNISPVRYSHPSIYRASRGKRKVHGISRGTVYRGTHFLGPNFNQNRLIFIFLMPTVNRVVLGLCTTLITN